MSITVSTDVFCDICCARWIHGAVGSRASIAYARKVAKRAGWGRCLADSKMLDICPDCVKKHSPPPTG